MKFTYLFVCMVVAISGSYGVTDEERKALYEAIMPIILECSQSNGITQDQLQSAKQAGSSANLGSCFIGCVLKKTGVINPQGLYDVDVAHDKLKQFLPNSEDFGKFQEVVKKCASVNDQAVSDGDTGCERTKLLMDCFRANNAAIPL